MSSRVGGLRRPTKTQAFLSWAVLATCLGAIPARADLAFTSYEPILVTGSATGSPADLPNNHVDPNIPASPFAGVGSLKVGRTGVGFSLIGTAVAIGPRYLLTAAHMVDGDLLEGTPTEITFNLNTSSLMSSFKVAGYTIHPDYDGFLGDSATHDDLAILELEKDLPMTVPVYSLYGGALATGTTLTMVGYGAGGSGDTGVTISPSWTVKRVGQNNADLFLTDDEGTAAKEVFLYDFDGPTAATNVMGGTTLGNNIEAGLAGGDSGGPSFILRDGEYLLAGINTFVAFGADQRPSTFGTGGGGMLVGGYLDWIERTAPGVTTVVPAPGALLLCAMGLGTVRLARRRFQTGE